MAEATLAPERFGVAAHGRHQIMARDVFREHLKVCRTGHLWMRLLTCLFRCDWRRGLRGGGEGESGNQQSGGVESEYSSSTHSIPSLKRKSSQAIVTHEQKGPPFLTGP